MGGQSRSLCSSAWAQRAIALARGPGLQLLEQADELPVWIGSVPFHDAVPPLPVLPIAVLQVGGDQVVLGGEIPVEAHLVDAGVLDHGVDADRAHAVAIE